MRRSRRRRHRTERIPDRLHRNLNIRQAFTRASIASAVQRRSRRPEPIPEDVGEPLLAEVDGNPHRVAFSQRVGSEEAPMSRLRVTLRVTARAETRERRRTSAGTTQRERDGARVVATTGSHDGARRVAARRFGSRCQHQPISEDVHHRPDRQCGRRPPGCRAPPTFPYRLGCRRTVGRDCRTRRHGPHRRSSRHRGSCRSRRSRQHRSHLTQRRSCSDGGSRSPVCVAPRQLMHQPDDSHSDYAAGQ